MTKKPETTNLFSIITRYMGVLMVIAYIVLGLAVLVFPETLTLKEHYARFLGSMLVGYGCYRGYRIYTKHFS